MIKIKTLSDSSGTLNGVWIEVKQKGEIKQILCDLDNIVIDRDLEKYVNWRK